MYFAKQFKQLEFNKQNKVWDRFPVGELRGKTMGVIGCGGKLHVEH
jgi:phosphoglycerate dehydrogenase-like enzyme